MSQQTRSGAYGTAQFHEDGETVRRSVTIRRPLIEVQQQFAASGIPGKATFANAAGDRGIELRVEASADEQKTARELFNAYTGDKPSDSLSAALRQLKARLETGEAPTTIGQPSGRESAAR